MHAYLDKEEIHLVESFPGLLSEALHGRTTELGRIFGTIVAGQLSAQVKHSTICEAIQSSLKSPEGELCEVSHRGTLPGIFRWLANAARVHLQTE